MSKSSKELLYLNSPVSVTTNDKENGFISVKGFASVETVDRSDDLVQPTEFMIDQFMAAPILLVNHSFWIDDRGNKVPAGKPVEMYAAKLAKLNDDEYAVIDLQTKKQVNTFPKAKIPNLKVGDRGLFVVAEVTQPDIIEMVKRGELSAFSWTGLVKVNYEINPNTRTTQRVYKDIDLYEISLVNMPDNVNATAVMGKSAHMMRLSKSRFENSDMAKAYLSSHGLECDLREDDEAFYSRQLPSEMIDVKQLVVVKMAEGVDVIVGPLQKSSNLEMMVLEEYNKIISLFNSHPVGISKKENVMSEEKSLKEDQSKTIDLIKNESEKEEVKKEAEKLETEKNKKMNTEESVEEVEKSKEAKALDALGKHLAEKVSANLMDGMKPFFEKMTTSMTTLSEGFTEVVRKMTLSNEENEEVESEKKEVEKGAKTWDALNEMALTLTNLQDQLVEVAKSAKVAERTAKAVADITPEEITREEKIEKSKSVDQDDPNAVFDSVFPFLK